MIRKELLACEKGETAKEISGTKHGSRFMSAPTTASHSLQEPENFGRSGCSDPPRTSAGRRGMKVAQRVSAGKG